jgi:hypothetical protein
MSGIGARGCRQQELHEVTMRGRCEFRLRLIGDDWLLTSWTVQRTAPIEGSEQVYDVAAARSSR